MTLRRLRYAGALQKLSGAKFYRPHYAPKIEGEDRSWSPSRHIIAELCAGAGIGGRIAIRPYLQLTEEEQKAGGWSSGKNHHTKQRNGWPTPNSK